MKQLLALLLAASFAAVSVGESVSAQPVGASAPEPGSTVLDFNSFSGNAEVGSNYAGVTVTGLCASNVYTGYFSGDPMQAGNFTSTGSLPCQGSYLASFSFTFAQVINSFGFYAISPSGTISFSTANGTYTTPLNTIARFVGFTDATGFTSVTLSATGRQVILDDVSYATAAPEPASIGLLAIGLIAVGGVVRRRRQR